MDKQEYIALETLYVEDEHGEAIELPFGTIIMFAPGDPVPQVMQIDRGAWGVRAGHVMPRVDVDVRKYWIMPDDFAKMIKSDAAWMVICRTTIQKKKRSFGLAKKQGDKGIKPYFDIRDGMIVKLELLDRETGDVLITFKDDMGEKALKTPWPVSILDMDEQRLVRPYLKRS